jgi:hypothetical protein
MPRFYLTTPPQSVTYVLNLLCILCPEPAPGSPRLGPRFSIHDSSILDSNDRFNISLLTYHPDLLTDSGEAHRFNELSRQSCPQMSQLCRVYGVKFMNPLQPL